MPRVMICPDELQLYSYVHWAGDYPEDSLTEPALVEIPQEVLDQYDDAVDKLNKAHQVLASFLPDDYDGSFDFDDFDDDESDADWTMPYWKP